MHGLTYEEFLSQLSGFLCGYYVLIASMNGLFALYRWKQKGEVETGIGLVRPWSGDVDYGCDGCQW